MDIRFDGKRVLVTGAGRGLYTFSDTCCWFIETAGLSRVVQIIFNTKNLCGKYHKR